MVKHQFEILILLVFVLVIIPSFLFLRDGYKREDSLAPTINSVSASQLTEVDSPDGKQTLIMKEHWNGNSGTTYALFISSKTEPGEKQIFSKTVGPSEKLLIPYNTWSPDYKYVFLKEDGVHGSSYSVIRDFQEVNINQLFAKKYNQYKITDVTGWAAPTLVIINTNKVDGTVGPSFWFDVSSDSFIQLSTRFN
jgi:hypothetical protein